MQEQTAREGLEHLRNVWRHDPSMGRRIDADVEAFERYAKARSTHVALSRATPSEYDADAVRFADDKRTRAHNEAIHAAADLNRCCQLAGIGPIAPVCSEDMQFKDKTHRNNVARFVADALDLTADQRHALDLK